MSAMVVAWYPLRANTFLAAARMSVRRPSFSLSLMARRTARAGRDVPWVPGAMYRWVPGKRPPCVQATKLTYQSIRSGLGHGRRPISACALARRLPVPLDLPRRPPVLEDDLGVGDLAVDTRGRRPRRDRRSRPHRSRPRAWSTSARRRQRPTVPRTCQVGRPSWVRNSGAATSGSRGQSRPPRRSCTKARGGRWSSPGRRLTALTISSTSPSPSSACNHPHRCALPCP